MATMQERAASVYTPEYFDQLRARNAWNGRPWIAAGGINEAGGTYRHALYEDGTFSPLLQGMRSEEEQAELVRQGQGDATSWMHGSAVPLRDLVGGQWNGNTYSLGGRDYTLDMERKASGGANTSLATLVAMAISMGALAPAAGGAGAAAEGGAAAGTAGGAGAFDAGMGNYLGLGTTADATAVGSSLGLGETAGVVGAGGAGEWAGTYGTGGDASWGVNAQQGVDPTFTSPSFGNGTSTPWYQQSGLTDPNAAAYGSGTGAGSGSFNMSDFFQNGMNNGTWDWQGFLQSLQPTNADYARMGVGTLLDMWGAHRAREDARERANAAADLSDPFRTQRPQYQKQFSQLTQNPSAFYNDPAVQRMISLQQDSTQRRLSSQGYNMSGNMGLETAQAGMDAAFKQYLPYSELIGKAAGAFNGPGYAGAMYNSGMSNSPSAMYDSGLLGVLANQGTNWYNQQQKSQNAQYGGGVTGTNPSNTSIFALS